MFQEYNFPFSFTSHFIGVLRLSEQRVYHNIAPGMDKIFKIIYF